MRLQTRMGAVNMDDIRRERSSSLWQNRLKTASHFIDFCRTVLRYYDCSNYCLCRLHWEMEIAHLVEKSVSTDNSLPRNAMRDRQTPNIGWMLWCQVCELVWHAWYLSGVSVRTVTSSFIINVQLKQRVFERKQNCPSPHEPQQRQYYVHYLLAADGLKNILLQSNANLRRKCDIDKNWTMIPKQV